MQISRRFVGLLSSSALQLRKWENLWRAPVLQSSMSTDSTRKASSRKNTRAPSAHPRVSTAAAESASLEDEPLQVSVKPAEDVAMKPAEDVAMKPVEDDPVKPVAGAHELPKPGQIPWQTKVANSVNLIGYLGAPIQLGISSSGIHTAVSVLINKKTLDLPQFWIPIIFRGDLAQIAACNLRENDHVYVTGQLTGQPEPVDNDAESKIQVLVNNISYVLELCAGKECEKSNEIPESSSAKEEDDPSITQQWKNFFQNPHRWWDNRSKDNKNYGTFKHKDSQQILEVNESTPGWVFSKLDSLTYNASNSVSEKKPGGFSKMTYWSDLLENPEQWEDNREGKRSGKLSPKFPDFSHKVTKNVLWLDSAPVWALSKLETAGTSPIRANVQSENKSTRKIPQGLEEKWKDLVENPKKWWDNRSNKMKPTHPDFKHKDTGDGLWLNSMTTPSWVHARLPSPMS